MWVSISLYWSIFLCRLLLFICRSIILVDFANEWFYSWVSCVLTSLWNHKPTNSSKWLAPCNFCLKLELAGLLELFAATIWKPSLRKSLCFWIVFKMSFTFVEFRVLDYNSDLFVVCLVILFQVLEAVSSVFINRLLMSRPGQHNWPGLHQQASRTETGTVTDTR